MSLEHTDTSSNYPLLTSIVWI